MKDNKGHVVIATSKKEVHRVETTKIFAAERAFKQWRKKGLRCLWYYEAKLPEMREQL